MNLHTLIYFPCCNPFCICVAEYRQPCAGPFWTAWWFFPDYISHLSCSFYILRLFSSLSAVPPSLVMSTELISIVSIPSSRSLMRILINIRCSTDPFNISLHFDDELLITTPQLQISRQVHSKPTVFYLYLDPQFANDGIMLNCQKPYKGEYVISTAFFSPQFNMICFLINSCWWLLLFLDSLDFSSKHFQELHWSF